VDTVTNATAAMAAVDISVNYISEARASLGGLVTRFDFRGQQLATSLENIEAAKSSIMDVDLAAEQSKLVSSQVLVQASVSALSQANELPQSLLRLLQ
jgi:flagellin